MPKRKSKPDAVKTIRSRKQKNESGHEAAVAAAHDEPSLPVAHFDFDSLDVDTKNLIKKWLVEGAPFEDVVERVAEPGKVTITQRAVEHYFRSNPAVQTERIINQTKAADELVKALHDPKSAEAKLARSVLVMGLSGLNRGEDASRVRHALQVMKEQKDERFKEADAQRKEAKFGIEEQESQIRVQSLQAKLQVATLQLGRLKQSIEKQGKDKSLGPEILQQINEIYGLVTVESSGNSSDEAHDA